MPKPFLFPAFFSFSKIKIFFAWSNQLKRFWVGRLPTRIFHYFYCCTGQGLTFFFSKIESLLAVEDIDILSTFPHLMFAYLQMNEKITF
jgi:hypothetical protein